MALDPFTIKEIVVTSFEVIKIIFDSKDQISLRVHNEKVSKFIDFEIKKYKNPHSQLYIEAKHHWEDAIYSTKDNIRNKSLWEANTLFIKMIELDQKEILLDNQQIDNSYLISYGYWGRYCYFGLHNDNNNSLIQVYECAIRYPKIATKIFNKDFFQKLDVSEFHSLCDSLESIEENGFIKNDSLYSYLPPNQAKALIQIQIDTFIEKCKEILNSLKIEKYG